MKTSFKPLRFNRKFQIGSAMTEVVIVVLAVAIGAGIYFTTLKPKLDNASQKSVIQAAYGLGRTKDVPAISSEPGGGIDVTEAGIGLKKLVDQLSLNSDGLEACAQLWDSRCANNTCSNLSPVPAVFFLSATSSSNSFTQNSDNCNGGLPAIANDVRDSARISLSAPWVVLMYIKPSVPPTTVTEKDFAVGPAGHSELLAASIPTVTPPSIFTHTHTPTPTALATATAGALVTATHTPVGSPTTYPSATPTSSQTNPPATGSPFISPTSTPVSGLTPGSPTPVGTPTSGPEGGEGGGGSGGENEEIL